MDTESTNEKHEQAEKELHEARANMQDEYHKVTGELTALFNQHEQRKKDLTELLRESCDPEMLEYVFTAVFDSLDSYRDFLQSSVGLNQLLFNSTVSQFRDNRQQVKELQELWGKERAVLHETIKHLNENCWSF